MVVRWAGADWIARDQVEDSGHDTTVTVKERTVRVQTPGAGVGTRKESRVAVTEFLSLPLGFRSPHAAFP